MVMILANLVLFLDLSWFIVDVNVCLQEKFPLLTPWKWGPYRPCELSCFVVQKCKGCFNLKLWTSFTMRLFLFFKLHFFLCILDVKDFNEPDALTSKIGALVKFFR